MENRRGTIRPAEVPIVAAPGLLAPAHFASVPRAAFRAVDFAGKRVRRIGALARLGPLFHLYLYGVEHSPVDDRWVAVLDVVLRHFALVHLVGLRKEVRAECLLQQGVPFVFFVCKNAHDSIGPPGGFAARCQNPARRQITGDVRGSLAFEEGPVDISHGLGLLGIDLRHTIRPLAVSEERAVRNNGLALGEPLTHSPCHVLGNTPAFLLGQAAHDRNEQLALGIQGEDVFLLEIHLNPCGLELSYRRKGIDRIPGEAADGFCKDQIDLPSHGRVYHGIESVAVLGAGSRDALVREHSGE